MKKELIGNKATTRKRGKKSKVDIGPKEFEEVDSKTIRMKEQPLSNSQEKKPRRR